MKKIIGLVVIIAALLLGSYYGMGFITERTIKKNMVVINQSNGLKVKIASYDRGWFTSKAVFDWHIHLPERQVKDDNGHVSTVAAQDYDLDMPLMIYHGPIIYSDQGIKFGFGFAHSEVKLPKVYDEQFSTTFTSDSIKPEVDLSLFVDYFNKSQIHVGVPTFKLISKEGGDQFQWNGLNSDISITSNLNKIDGHLDLEGGVFTKNNAKATLSQVTSQYDLYQNDLGLYLGQANLSMSAFQISDQDQALLDIEQINLQTSSDVTNGLFNSHLKTTLNKMTSQGKTYGPATLEVSLDNIDAQVLADINVQANKMQQGNGAERQQALLALLPQLPKLVNKGAKLEISTLNIVVPEGDIAGSLSLSFPEGDTSNPLQLMQKLQGQAKLKVPASVLQAFMLNVAKQHLLTEPSLQDAMVQQMKANNEVQAATAPAPDKKPASDTSVNTKAAKPETASTPQQPAEVSQPQAKTLTPAELDQQATVLRDQKLAKLIQIGLVTLQGNEYVVELSLQAGQLTVNGKAFTPEMMQF